MSTDLMARRRRSGFLVLAAFGLVLLLAPSLFLTSGYRLEVARLTLYMAILAATWSLLAGVAGQFSFAHVAIAGLAAYTSAIWVRDVAGAFGSVYVGIVVGALFAGVVGTLLGVLLLRLRVAYLALFTVAFAELARLIVVAESDLTGGRLSLAVRKLPGGDLAHYYLILVLLVVILGLIYWLLRSRLGLFLRAMREDEDAAAALGVNVMRAKVLVFSVTSLMVGFGATMYTHTVSRIGPERLELLVMGQVIAVAVIGGLESPLAAVIGALVVFWLLENLRVIDVTPFGMDVITVLVALMVIVLGYLVVRATRAAREPIPGDIVRLFPWLGVGAALCGVFLFTVGTTEGGALLGAWTALIAGAACISVFVMRSYARGLPEWLERVYPAIIVGTMAIAVLARLVPAESVRVELGFWRFGVFGAVLMLTLRFARNGLVYPLLQYFAGVSELRKETVAFRDGGGDEPEPPDGAVATEGVN